MGDQRRLPFCRAPAPDIEQLWASGISPKPQQPGDRPTLAFLGKKADGDKPVTLGVNETADIGPQYPLLKNDDMTLLTRLGSGYSRQYLGLSDGKAIPELLLGCQLEQHLSGHNKVFGALEYAWDPADFGRRRVRAKAAWEVPLDSENRVSLRTSVLEASSYAPSGEQAKNVNYGLDLIWKF